MLRLFGRLRELDVLDLSVEDMVTDTKTIDGSKRKLLRNSLTFGKRFGQTKPSNVTTSAVERRETRKEGPLSSVKSTSRGLVQ